ncbi:hypothetical protein BP5796_08256 [Coleophoma crateriformis]|uniref:Major facilitator superfamily (MFS) profile domain-containing protein n=1 Tax=Coleophoma crateriformis TaxID=565419 RepID=A0A3D8RDX0_9HELO|nr:hypothetical protein BP5796_08256 [Coleophoma crateriformis]
MEKVKPNTMSNKAMNEKDLTPLSHNDPEVSGQAHGSPSWDKAEESRLLWKMDLMILPALFVFYTLSFLDRINIGNAAIEGLNEDLGLNLFYGFYIIMEVPSNMILKNARPSLYLPTLMFGWGIITLCMGFLSSYQAFYGLRLLLGFLEAGLVPGIIYVTSMYYRRHEYQKRFSLIFVATSVGGGFGGLLAYAIANLSGSSGYAGWRWIYIIEGSVTCFIAALAPLILVDWPDKCRFFSPAERELIHLRLIDDGGEFRMDTLDRHAAKRIVLDWKIYLGSLTCMGLTTSTLAISVFLPVVLSEFGWKASEAQIHTIPIYMFTLVLTLLLSWISDRIKHRYGFIMLCCVMATIGYGMLLNSEHLSRGTKYGACFLIAGGGLCSGPITIVFLSNNLAGHWKRSVGSAILVSFSGIAGIIGTLMFLNSQKPLYHTGFATGLGMAWLSGFSATIMVTGMWIENRKRDRGERNDRLSWPEEILINLGDYHPGFRYTL